MESNHHENRAMGKEGEAKQTSQAKPLEKKKWWYACRLFGTNSLKEGAMWLVHLLPGNDHEISNYTTAVNSNRGTVFSVRSVPRCYKQDKLVE
jgi:hypothetical protein